MKNKKSNLFSIALGAASVGIAAAALAKGIPLLKAKLMAKRMPNAETVSKKKPIKGKAKKSPARGKKKS